MAEINQRGEKMSRPNAYDNNATMLVLCSPIIKLMFSNYHADIL